MVTSAKVALGATATECIKNVVYQVRSDVEASLSTSDDRTEGDTAEVITSILFDSGDIYDPTMKQTLDLLGVAYGWEQVYDAVLTYVRSIV